MSAWFCPSTCGADRSQWFFCSTRVCDPGVIGQMFGTCLLYLSAVLEPCVQLDWESEDNLLSPVEEHQLQLRSSDLYPDPRVEPRCSYQEPLRLPTGLFSNHG
ncbi:hypothetical protein ATANTOWER_004090 [Ataeniobius toweri]|uniref:Uncharacterized protein n=1 Tax=Ataeniobius toweri TaxID=208326 RepID=A0ABU7BZX8_9TELE|nr:hypothetical protein [Ataeniobius toweri]